MTRVRLIEGSGLTGDLAPHMYFGNERRTDCNGKRLEAERNETALLVQGLGPSIAIGHCKLNNHNSATLPRVIEYGEDKRASYASMSELGRNIHTEQRGFVLGPFAFFERYAGNADDARLSKRTENDITRAWILLDARFPPGHRNGCPFRRAGSEGVWVLLVRLEHELPVCDRVCGHETSDGHGRSHHA